VVGAVAWNLHRYDRVVRSGMMAVGLAVALVAGCAQARIGEADDNGGVDGGLDQPDSATTPIMPPDAGAPDAAPNVTTLSHSTSTAVTGGHSVSCNSGGLHAENSYYRVFDLASFSVETDFEVTSMAVGIDLAAGANGTQPITVRLHTLGGPLALANLTELAAVNLTVPDQQEQILDVPIQATAPAGSTLVAEVLTPDGQQAGNTFFVGANAAGQSGPSFIRAPSCNAAEPADLAGVGDGFPNVHVILTVTGEHF
jgi:hypothetical protein